MHARHQRQSPAPAPEGANGRFKRSFSSWFWGSMIAAAALHFLVFALLPNWEPEDVSLDLGGIEAIDILPEIETIEIPPAIELLPAIGLPPPPEAMARPATPVVEDILILRCPMWRPFKCGPRPFYANPVENLPPPPDEVKTDISAAPVFTPRTVDPTLRNPAEVARALYREYPPPLRDAGIGGVVLMWFFINENGVVENQVVNQSSGHRALDEAALRIAPLFQFKPALNRDAVVPVWVSIPINFTANQPRRIPAGPPGAAHATTDMTEERS